MRLSQILAHWHNLSNDQLLDFVKEVTMNLPEQYMVGLIETSQWPIL